ncbi:MAG: hypothetical protein ABSH16_00130 [Sedimentisphaerales bacterium]
MDEILTLQILRKSTPSLPAMGYGDRGRLFKGTDPTPIWEADELVSSCCNPYDPRTKDPWDAVYTCICCGCYKGKVINDARPDGHGWCIVLNDYGPVPTILPSRNAEHYGKFIATEVLVHKGYSPTWRGSAACITIHPDVYEALFALLSIDTELQVALIHGDT